MADYVDENAPIGMASAIRHLQRGYARQRDRLDEAAITATRAKDAADQLERRVTLVEATKPEVMQATLATLVEDVQSLRRALYTFAFSVVGGALLFAFTAIKVVG